MKLFVVLLFLISFNAQGALRVTIDPGHGGEEKGAVHGGVIEAQLALKFAKKLYHRLKKDKKYQVQLIRKNDSTLSLEDRVKKSKNYKTDLFLSIHANASPSKKAKGAEFYIQNQLPVDQETLFLAHTEHSLAHEQSEKPRGDVEAILYDLNKSHKILKSYQISSFMRKKWTNKKGRMIRQGPFFVLSQNEIPAILIEVGYLTNPKERNNLTQNDYQNQVVRKIHLALNDYLKNVDKLPRGILKPRDAKTR